MGKRFINGSDFADMALLGAENLQRGAERVNALNVFPVPDGDTGTNMNLTMASGVRELQNKRSESVGRTAEALSKGLLMGARGNSGVILSQLFRGTAKALSGLDEAGPAQFAAALQQGVDMAYKAVVKPVEGTILTVAREAARHAQQAARRTSDMETLMQEVYDKANETLQRTPDMLPVLKQVGVVDSGGQGLVLIYEGFLDYLTGRSSDTAELVSEAAPVESFQHLAGMSARTAEPVRAAASTGGKAQAQLSTNEIEFFYDMEFFIKRKLAPPGAPSFDEDSFRRALAKDGDSIIVIADEEIVKVHVHSRRPGDVLNLALPYGELAELHILNMRDQHRELVGDEDFDFNAASADLAPDDALAVAEVLAGSMPQEGAEAAHEWAPYGIVAVAIGEGISGIFLDNNVDVVLSGGQTMNPSTEDFLKAIESLPAEHIFLLPNNSNIILAAEQAAELSERSVSVIPTRTVPQGLASVLAFKDGETPERNAALMAGAAEAVRSGSVTQAVRNTEIDGVEVQEGDFIGIVEKKIVVSEADLQLACRGLISELLENGGDLLTILTGEGSGAEGTEALAAWVSETYPEVELEVHEGGQPLYPYLFALE
ncbi:DAK2 domain-containing protein [Paenibacillus pasadenensis]|uniref:DAK2 domain-containing protein n=1 Tax=Paenibacillus pasadenensis TaxID=217090 RepID=UPI00204077B9|nr:DAK2 domain-containing protein [Paenibacillus pasadenensis]MCM3746134.1 DAK2 domain-containing protein [Paenibacillus pasadenensis]